MKKRPYFQWQTEDGSKSIHCKNCTAKKDVQVIPATGKPGSGDNKPGTGDGQTGGSTGNTGNAGSNKPGSTAGKPGAQAGTVKTGDSANWMLWTVLIGVSLAGCTVAVRKRKSNR